MQSPAADAPVRETPTAAKRWGITTIPQALERAAETDRGVTMIDSDLRETRVPWAALAERSARAAARLARDGVEPGDRIGLFSSTNPELLVGLLGAWRIGAVPVVLPLPTRPAEFATVGEDVRRRAAYVDARSIVVADAFSSFLTGVDLGAPVVLTSELSQGRRRIDEPAPSEGTDIAYLQFTSGTTASSRAVALTHSQMLDNAASIWDVYGVSPEEALPVSWLPLFHDMGLMSVVMSMALTNDIVLEPPEEFIKRPGSWIDALSRYVGATAMVAPNFAYALATRYLRSGPTGLDLSHVILCGNGAEAIDLETFDAFLEEGKKYGLREETLCPMYGLAEATVAVAITPPTEPMRRVRLDRERLENDGVAVMVGADHPNARELATCGRPIPGNEVMIAAEDGSPCPDGVVGEVCVRGTSIMDGYWKDPEATAATFRDGWLRTGDLAFMDEGHLVVCGRIKDMIIVGGRNLYPEDFEWVAQHVPGVRPVVAAFALSGSEKMVVAVEARDEVDHQDLADRVMQTLSERLSHSPDRVLVVERGGVPRTSSGKTQRGRARALLESDELPILATSGE